MTIKVYEGKTEHDLPFEAGQTILTVLQNAGIRSITAPCGGNGTCGKCTVEMHSGSRAGKVLACKTAAEDGMVVELVPEVRISFADTSNADIYPPTPGQEGYAAACDIGTTKVVCRLADLQSGRLLAKISGSSSQRIFGGDVLSRLKAAEEGHAEELHGLIIRQIDYYISELCREQKIRREEIKLLSVTGNTIMMHFFAGLNPAQISTAPFKPVSLFGEMQSGRELGMDFEGQVYICPAVSGFIGSDTVCSILSSGLAASEKPSLLVDLGTNTEIAVGDKNGITACAADGGAAFKASLLEHGMTASAGAVAGVKYEDGALQLTVLGAGKPAGVCGSGFIDVLGILYEHEILDEMGHIASAEEAEPELARYIGQENGSPVFYLTEDHTIFISQADISKFQLAKAAVSAGISILADEENVPLDQIDRCLLGGGFGTFVQEKNAALLGLIPSECAGRTCKLGNSALAGAVSAAISESARAELERIRGLVKVIDLPTHPDFSDAYVDGMMFE